jgi:hypothetical protein
MAKSEGKSAGKSPAKVAASAGRGTKNVKNVLEKEKPKRSPQPKKVSASGGERLFTIGAGCAILGVLKKAWSEKESYLKPIIAVFKNNLEAYEEWQVTDIVFRRASDGSNRVMKASGTGAIADEESERFGFRQLVYLLPEGTANTQAVRKEWAENLVNHLNTLGQDISSSDQDKYDFRMRFQYKGDLSSTPLRAVNKYTTDKDALSLLRQAYSSVDMETLLEFDDIISAFFQDLEHGKNIVREQW